MEMGWLADHGLRLNCNCNNIFYFPLPDPFNGMVPPESLCRMEYNSNSYQPKERRLETSLSLELRPSSFSGPCKQLLEAPPSHGLYVRVYPINAGEKSKNEYSTSGASVKNMNIDDQRTRNTTSIASCPLNIVSRHLFWSAAARGILFADWILI